jgi:PAS domain S-box-containing protein
MLDNLTDGMVVIGADWRFRYVNEPGARILGHRREDLVGRTVADVFPEFAGESFHAAYEQALRERRPVRIVDHYAPAGRWYENRIFPHDDELVVVFRDITGAQRTGDELREYADRMSQAERIASFGVWNWDLASGRVRWSDELHRIYGLEPGEFPGTVDAFVSRLHPDDRDRVWAEIAHAIDALEPFVFEERIVRDDGTQRILLSQGRVVAGPDGRAASVVGVCHDVTERTEAQRALGLSEQRMRAIIDNTPSIIAVKDLSGRFLMSNAETGRVLGVDPELIIGHECADLFGPELAERLRANDQRAAAEGEAVYDEAILFRDGEPRTYVTVTFALPDASGLPVETCTIATDVTEQRERESERRERRDWQRRIQSAVADGRMAVYAQPVVELVTGRRSSHELLVRMIDDDGQMLEPTAFLPAAERYGLVQTIDVWMVAQALRLPAGVRPEVNLSAVTMSDPAALREIVALLLAAPEAARDLVFEITETAAAAHLGSARAFADDVTVLGCGLALDDFGTGFGSFTYLRELPLRYLKIDTTFVTDLAGSAHDRRVVQSIISIAEQFGLRTIAEGVEDDETLELLREMGSHYAQGFLVGRPVPVASALPIAV